MCEAAALAAAAAHACARWPLEACGLAVRAAAGVRFVPVVNVSPDPRTSFAFAPAEQLALWRAEAAGHLAIVAIVHSHCDADASFSERDRRDATTADGHPLYPGVEHWVLSIRGPGPRLDEAVAWTWRPGGWTGRALAPTPVAGCPSCVGVKNRL